MVSATKLTTEVAQKEPDTLAKYFRRNSLIWGDKIAMRQKDFGIWIRNNWKECYEKSKAFGLGLLSLGFKEGDKVCLLGDNEFETYWGVYGVYGVRGTIVGIWVDALPDEAVYYVNDSQSRFMLIRDQEQADKLLRVRDKIPAIEKVIWWEPKGMNAPTYANDPWFIGFEKVCALGQEYEKEHPGALEDYIDRGKPDDICNMYYTAGTTGAAKGVVRTHAQNIAFRETLNKYYPISLGDNVNAIFQFASIGEALFGTTCNLMQGVTLHFAESPDTSEMDFREIGPKHLAWTPRFWESIASKMQVRISDAGFIKKSLFNLLLPVGYKVASLEMEEVKPNLLWRALHKVAYWLAFRPNLDKSGLLKTERCWNSGFVLGLHTYKFFRAIGLDMREFYMSTELPAIATQRHGEKIRVGSLGQPVDGVEIRVSNDGEFYWRSPQRFTEYYRKPEKTAAAIDKFGWYHSGDAGTLDDEGNVFYMDRASELAQIASGFKYSPQGVEAQVRFGAYIKDCWIIGEDRDFVSAIITIDFDSVSKWAERQHIPFTTMLDLSQKDEVGELALVDIMRVNKALPELVRIKKYAVFHKEFDPDEAELTRSRKLRREFMFKKYGEIADAIYQEKKSVPVTATFSYKSGAVATVSADIKIRDVPLAGS